MIDAETVLEIAIDAAGRQNPLTTISDLKTLYNLYQQIQAGKLSIAGMIKSGTLKSDIAAIAREAILASALLADPAMGPKIEALIEGLS